MDAIKLLRNQQAMNRLSFAEQQQPKSIDSLYCYIGFDAETGMALATDGTNTIRAGRATNGAIKPKQPVKTLQAGGRFVIDAMPSPKPSNPATPDQKGKIKVLFTTIQGGRESEDGTISLWVGGWTDSPIKIATYPFDSEKFTRIIGSSINNLGSDRWIAAWRYETLSWIVSRDGHKIYAQDWITKSSNSGTWLFSETETGKSLRLTEQLYDDTAAKLLATHLGFGFWRIKRYDFAAESYNVGYWLKDELSYSIATTVIQPELDTSLPVNQAETFLVNDSYQQSYGAWRALWDVSRGIDAALGYWVFSGSQFKQEKDPDHPLYDPTHLQDSNPNWIDSKLYLVSPGFSYFNGSYKTGGKLDVVQFEFGIESPLLKKVRSFKEYVYPLKPNANVLALSYHP